MAREAQKKALIEAQSIIANNQVKVGPLPVPDNKSSDPVDEPTKNVLTTTQWLSVISKREEIKGMFAKKPPLTLPPAPPNSPRPGCSKPRLNFNDFNDKR